MATALKQRPKGAANVLYTCPDCGRVFRGIGFRPHKPSSLPCADVRTPRDDLPRFFAKVLKVEGGCWLWQSQRVTNGYGQIHWKGRPILAHRFAYEALVGPIPDGLDLDHVCRTRECVNPAHLEPVGRAENIRRGYAARAKGF